MDETKIAIPLDSNGVVSKDDKLLNALLNRGYGEVGDTSLRDSRELSNFILKVCDLCSSVSTKIVSSLNSYDKIKHEFNDLTDYRTRRVKLMKDSLMEIKNIGKSMVNILGKQNMKNINTMEMSYKQNSTTRGRI